MQLLEEILEEINSPDVNLTVSALSQWFYFVCLFVCKKYHYNSSNRMFKR